MKKIHQLFEALVEKLFFTVSGMIVFLAFIYFLMSLWMLKYAEVSRNMKEEEYNKPVKIKLMQIEHNRKHK